MDAKPKSNKMKRLEQRRKREERADRRSQARTARAATSRATLADHTLDSSNSPWRGTRHVLHRMISGEAVQVSAHSDLFPIAQIFANVCSNEIRNGFAQQPDRKALGALYWLAMGIQISSGAARGIATLARCSPFLRTAAAGSDRPTTGRFAATIAIGNSIPLFATCSPDTTSQSSCSPRGSKD